MILLVTPSRRATECATAIANVTGQPAQAAASFQQGAALLRTQSYSAVVVDESLLDADPDQGNAMLQHIGSAVPVFVNCAISGIQRLVDTVQNALRRRAGEEVATRKSALQILACELREPLSGIILNCELLLNASNLPPFVNERIQTVADLARTLGAKLESEPLQRMKNLD